MTIHLTECLLAEALKMTELVSPVQFKWFGQPSPSPHQGAVARREQQDAFLGAMLASRLYEDFYCPGRARPGKRQPLSEERDQYRQLLHEANAGIGSRDWSWRLLAVDEEGRLIVARDQLLLTVDRRDVLAKDSPDGTSARVGLAQPKGSRHVSPGFYVAYSNVPWRQHSDVIRTYWNLGPSGSVEFMAQSTSRLNTHQLPFLIKVVDSPSRHDRLDSAVCYVPLDAYEQAVEPLSEVHERLAGMLRDEVPPFTKRIGRGVGLAESPADDSSFGMNRCRLVAEALVDCGRKGIHDVGAQLGAVREQFERAGLALQTPYLNPGSRDVYEVMPDPPAVYAEKSSPAGDLNRTEALGVATSIGFALVDEAIWFEGQCSWLGYEARRDPFGGANWVIAHRGLGSDLYSGSSGVALFLAELHAVNGEDALRSTAIGAMRQALNTAQSIPPSIRFGLFTGWTGVALACALVGRLLEQDAFSEKASEVIKGLRDVPVEDPEPDLLAGLAGGIIGMLALSHLLQDPDLVEMAIEAGTQLAASAVRVGDVVSWISPASSAPRNLTGLSHGAAGIAAACLELHHATGEDPWLELAKGALAYERSWYDEDARNWPDFRETDIPVVFSTTWCHGAPGIALQRSRAHELTGDLSFAIETKIARETIETAILESWSRPPTDFSMCHGSSGLASILHRLQPGNTLTRGVARRGLDQFAASSSPWPCGAGGGEDPGLMTGLAGIGHFYLEAAGVSVPSVLLLRPDEIVMESVSDG